MLFCELMQTTVKSPEELSLQGFDFTYIYNAMQHWNKIKFAAEG